MSAADLGTRLGIAPQSVLTLEISESEGRARMVPLRKRRRQWIVLLFMPSFQIQVLKSLSTNKLKKSSLKNEKSFAHN